MGLKLNNIVLNNLKIQNNINPSAFINNYTLEYKKVGHNENIHKGDFVSLDNNYNYYYPEVTKATTGVAASRLNDNLNSPQIISLYSDDSENMIFDICNINKENIENIKKIIIDKTKNIGNNLHVIYLSNNKIFCCGRSKVDYKLISFVIDFSTSTPSIGEPYILVNDNSSSTVCSAICLSQNIAIIAYNSGNNLYIKKLTVENTSIVDDSEPLLIKEYSNTSFSGYCLHKINNNKILIFFQGDNSSLKNIGLLTFENNTLALNPTYLTINSNSTITNYCYTINDNLVLFSSKETTAYSSQSELKELKILGNNMTIGKTVWKTNGFIGKVTGNSTNIVVLVLDNSLKKDYLIILDKKWNELNKIEVHNMAYSFTSPFPYLRELLEINNQFIIFISDYYYTTKPIKILLVNWDGNSLKVEDEYIRAYRGKSLYGIAAENGKEGDTITVYVPTIIQPQEEEPTEGE